MFLVKKLQAAHSFCSNTYLVSSMDECAVVDPSSPYRTAYGRVKYVLLTHAHFDHMLAASDLLRQTGAQLAVHTKDAAALCDPDRNLSAWDPAFRLEPLKADRLLYEGDRLQVGEMCLPVLHTPGHTEGSCCFYDENKGVLFSGDTLG